VSVTNAMLVHGKVISCTRDSWTLYIYIHR